MISPTRPASSRAVICRSRPRRRIVLAQPRDKEGLRQHDPRRHQAEPQALQQDERHGGDRLAAQKGRCDEGIADEAAQRLHLVLDHGGHLGLLDLAHLRDGEAQDSIGQLIAQPAQHALAQASLAGVDDEFEAAIDHNHEQEGEAQRHQVLGLGQREAVEQPHRCQVQPIGEGQIDDQERLRGPGTGEADPLDAAIDDALGQIEGEEIERQ
jgi:hypothetical protein